MLYIGARWYDPAVGRWTSADKWLGDIYHPLSLNRYLYCEDDPVNAVDPSGRAAAAVGALVLVPGVGQVVTAGIIAVGATIAVIWLASQAEEWWKERMREHEEEKKTWRYETRQPSVPPIPPDRSPDPKGPKEWIIYILGKLSEIFHNFIEVVIPVFEAHPCGSTCTTQ
ncbi:MAG: hypothetical protein KatS3mg022_3315 [Armatimonadota bacterium]|nr:MAG: hypothetical protein KatS3mg022_3315 [Armatimonadota bacterium]